MRRVTFYFICAELLDVITTIVGLSMGLKEIQPFLHLGWGKLLLLKTISTTMVIIALQVKKPHKLDIIIPIITFAVVIWNIINIILG